jgi:hypothetical protein
LSLGQIFASNFGLSACAAHVREDAIMYVFEKPAANEAGPGSEASVSRILNFELASLPLANRDTRERFVGLLLYLIRFIGAAYTTGDASCWEEAYRCVENWPEPIDGPLLIARAASLVRAVRCNRACEVCYFPSPCRFLSIDEARLVAFIQAALDAEPAAVETAAWTLCRTAPAAEMLKAASSLTAFWRDMVGPQSLGS